MAEAYHCLDFADAWAQHAPPLATWVHVHKRKTPAARRIRACASMFAHAEAKTLTVSPWTGQSDFESWRGSDPHKSVLPRESVSEPRDRNQVTESESSSPYFCGRGITGARRGRRGRRGNRATPEHELQPRTTCVETSYCRGLRSSNVSTERGLRHDQDDHYQE